MFDFKQLREKIQENYNRQMEAIEMLEQAFHPSSQTNGKTSSVAVLESVKSVPTATPARREKRQTVLCERCKVKGVQERTAACESCGKKVCATCKTHSRKICKDCFVMPDR